MASPSPLNQLGRATHSDSRMDPPIRDSESNPKPSENKDDANVVFIDTNLDTHLAVLVSDHDRVSHLKEQILSEHPLCFPKLGQIQIHAMKVKRNEYFYHLPDSMFVKSAFCGFNTSWLLSVEASSLGERVTNKPKKSKRSLIHDADVMEKKGKKRSSNSHESHLISIGKDAEAYPSNIQRGVEEEIYEDDIVSKDISMSKPMLERMEIRTDASLEGILSKQLEECTPAEKKKRRKRKDMDLDERTTREKECTPSNQNNAEANVNELNVTSKVVVLGIRAIEKSEKKRRNTRKDKDSDVGTTVGEGIGPIDASDDSHGGKRLESGEENDFKGSMSSIKGKSTVRVLRSSNRYKIARRIASQLEGSESEPEFVPDSLAE